MIMIDGGLRGEFRRRLRDGWHWQSIENLVGRGVPDSNFCFAGVEGWTEFKKTDGWAVTLKKEQVGWILGRVARGGNVFVITRRKHNGGPKKGKPVDELWIHSGEYAAQLKAGGLKSADPLYYGTGGPSKWDWNVVGEILARGIPRH